MIERGTGSWLVVCVVLSAAVPAGGQAPGEVFRDCDVCPEMVPLPEGDVALGRYEVTLEEYRAFAEAVPNAAEARCRPRRRSWRDPGYVQTGRHPVACVSWNEAQTYAEWLSLRTGRQYRLPTEAEWNRGAAGSPMGGCYMQLNGGGTCAVGLFQPSDAGIFDMEGNLREWTDSCWDGNCDRKLTRGAGWQSRPRLQRSDLRGWAGAGDQRFTIGFRVATTLPTNYRDSVETSRSGDRTTDSTHPQDPEETITKMNDGHATWSRAVDSYAASDTTTMAAAPVTAAEQVNHVFVEVLDQAGRPVPDLTAADFSLQENNVDLDIVSARRGTPRPMRIALIVDNGGRVAAPAERDALRGGLAAFLCTLPPPHEISLYTIRGQVRRRVGATTDRVAINDAIGRMRVGPRARVGLLDSVREASESRYEDDEPFPVIVLVLPNGDEDRGDAPQDADLQMARLAAAGIMVHAVVLEPRSARGLTGQDERALPGIARDLTQLLRGVYMTLTSRTQLSLGLARVASRLAAGYERMSMQYRVSYVHSGAEDAEIMVGVKRPDVSVRPIPQLQLY